ncbi:MAG: hypothetical protein J6Y75_06655 [Spirochaetaceae bacterium]|nr:hypothetical protein [Spirochaetaceae bacterium]
MDVRLDGVPLDIVFETEKTVGDVLRGMEEELEKNEATIVEIQADSEVFQASQLDALFEKTIDSVKELSLKSVSYTDVKDVALKIFEQFASLPSRLEQVPLQFQQNKDNEAMASVSELADSLSALFDLLPYFSFFPNHFEKIVIDGTPITAFIQELNPLLQDFLQAVEMKDTVTIGDIAEYEFAPRMRQISECASLL